jgi:uncharacterized protein
MAASIDQQFIEYIVKSLVNKPDEVKIERRIDEKGVLLELTVDAEDLGRVIGKRGATAQSLRTLLRALGTKNDARYNLKIVDVGEPPAPRQRRDDKADEPAPDDELATSDQPVDDSPNEEIVEEEQVEEEVVKEDEPSDVVSRTRAELADLDDLEL